jgi:hypothetical protein
MAGEPGPLDADVIVYLDHSDIHEGRLEELEQGIRRVVAVIQELEQRLIAYGFHLDAASGRMTVTAVHPDSESLERHLEVGREQFRSLSDLITLTGIEVYGSISDRALEMLEQKAAMLGGSGVEVHERFAGFARKAGAGD